jgi:TFIIH basal transcription factor complex TTD-A subunit
VADENPGVLVKCDASIKAMLVAIDHKEKNEFIVEELDEEHILVKETKVAALKFHLQQVRSQEALLRSC